MAILKPDELREMSVKELEKKVGRTKSRIF